MIVVSRCRRYRGVTHHPSGRWEARIGVPGSKHIYLGLFDEEDEAGAAYDRALVRCPFQQPSLLQRGSRESAKCVPDDLQPPADVPALPGPPAPSFQVLLRGASAATNFSLTDYREQLSEYHQVPSETCVMPRLPALLLVGSPRLRF